MNDLPIVPIQAEEHLSSVKGHVILSVWDVERQCVVEWTSFGNLVVTAFRVQSVHALGGDGVIGDYEISQMQVGTNGGAAVVGDVAITAPATFAITTSSLVTNRSAQFVGTLGSAFGNGATYQEVGLLMANNTLVARRVFGAMEKSAAFAWTFTWTLTW